MYAKVGRLSNVSGINKLVSDADGHLMVTAAGAKYADLVDSDRVFSVANQAAVTTTAGLATDWAGLSVYNPSASVVDLVMLEFGCTQFAVGAAGSIGLMISDGTAMGAILTPKPAKVGSSTVSAATVDTANATIGTPVLYRVYGSVGSLATSGYGLVPGLVVDLQGSLILQPGYSVCTYTTAATTTALIFHFTWAEIAR